MFEFLLREDVAEGWNNDEYNYIIVCNLCIYICSKEIQKFWNKLWIVMYLDWMSYVIGSMTKSYFFHTFFCLWQRCSGSKDANGAWISFGNSVGGADNNICDSSSSSLYNRCINKCTSWTKLNRKYFWHAFELIEERGNDVWIGIFILNC